MKLSEELARDLRYGAIVDVSGWYIGLRRVRRIWFNPASGHYVADTGGMYLWADDLMKNVWRCAPPLPAPTPAAGAADRETVAGIEARGWNSALSWSRANFIRLHNPSARTVFLDSLRMPSDSLPSDGFTQPLQLVFASRNPANGHVEAFLEGLRKVRPIAIPAGDSLDLGLFEIGEIKFLLKTSAALRRYRIGDSITQPLTFFAGADSLRIILKAKVQGMTYGDALAPVRMGRRPSSPSGRSVTADGRALSDPRPALRIRFGENGPETSAPPR